MNCPRCKNHPLTPRQHRPTGVALDVCDRCKGILFDAGELDRVLDVAARDLQPPRRDEQPPTVLCPRCVVPMAAFHYPQTVATVDMCRDCRGIWLDGGELKEIRTVREALRRKNALEEWAPVPGLKGTLLRFIQVALARLTKFD